MGASCSSGFVAKHYSVVYGVSIRFNSVIVVFNLNQFCEAILWPFEYLWLVAAKYFLPFILSILSLTDFGLQYQILWLSPKSRLPSAEASNGDEDIGLDRGASSDN